MINPKKCKKFCYLFFSKLRDDTKKTGFGDDSLYRHIDLGACIYSNYWRRRCSYLHNIQLIRKCTLHRLPSDRHHDYIIGNENISDNCNIILIYNILELFLATIALLNWFTCFGLYNLNDEHVKTDMVRQFISLIVSNINRYGKCSTIILSRFKTFYAQGITFWTLFLILHLHTFEIDILLSFSIN